MGEVIVDEVIRDRANDYGDYYKDALVSQTLKGILRTEDGWFNLSCKQRESMDMICSKISRIICGNPNHRDSWVDIAGYATLATPEE